MMIQKTNLKNQPFCRQAVGLQENSFSLDFLLNSRSFSFSKRLISADQQLDRRDETPEPTLLVAFAAHTIPPTHESTPDRRLHSALVHGFNSFTAGACCVAVQAPRLRFPQLRDLRRPHWFLRFWPARYHPPSSFIY